MKKFILLLFIMGVVLFACEKITPQGSYPDDEKGVIIFGKPVESGYDVTEESINGWLIINDITYTAECSYFEACEMGMITELAFMDMDSWIISICIRDKEVVEILEERIEDDIVYRKYKMRCPIIYDNFSFDLFYIEERAFADIENVTHLFPSPNIESSLVYDKQTRQPDMVLNGKTYKCYLVELGINLSCAEKSILCETSFLALDED